MRRRKFINVSLVAASAFSFSPLFSGNLRRVSLEGTSKMKILGQSLWANLMLDHLRKSNHEEYVLYLDYIIERYKKVGQPNELPSGFAVFQSANGLRNAFNMSKNPQVLLDNLPYKWELFLDMLGKVPILGDGIDLFKHVDYLKQEMALMDYFSIQSRYDYPINRFKNIFLSQNAEYFRNNSFDLMLQVTELAQTDPDFAAQLIEFNKTIGFSYDPRLSPQNYIQQKPALDTNGFLSRSILTLQSNDDDTIGVLKPEDYRLLQNSLFDLPNDLLDVPSVDGSDTSTVPNTDRRLSLQEDLDYYRVGLSSSVAVLSLLDSKSATKLSIIGNAGIEMFSIYNNPYGWSSTFVGFGMAGAGISAISALSALSKPSESQVIVDFLKAFSQEVFRRLDIIDKKLDFIIAGLDKMYSDILGEIQDLGFQLDRVRAQVDRFEQNVRSYFDELNKKERFRLELNCLKPSSILLNRSLTKDEFEDCLRSIVEIASLDSAGSLATGGSNRNYGKDGVFEELDKYPISYNLTYLKVSLNKWFSQDYNNEVVPNPIEWIYGAKAFLHVIADNPNYSNNLNIGVFSKVISPGIKINNFLRSISTERIIAMLDSFPVLTGSPMERIIKSIETDQVQTFPVDKSLPEPVLTFDDQTGKRLTQPPIPLKLGDEFYFPTGINSKSSIYPQGLIIRQKSDYKLTPYLLRNYVLVYNQYHGVIYSLRSGSGNQSAFDLRIYLSGNSVREVGLITYGNSKFRDSIVKSEYIEYIDETIYEKAKVLVEEIKTLFYSKPEFQDMLTLNRIKFRLLRETLMSAYGDILFKNNDLYQRLHTKSPLDLAIEKYALDESKIHSADANIKEINLLEDFATSHDKFISKLKHDLLDFIKSAQKDKPKYMGSLVVEETIRQLNHAKTLLENGKNLPKEYKLTLIDKS